MTILGISTSKNSKIAILNLCQPASFQLISQRNPTILEKW